jgi:elongation factor Ts
MAYEPSVKEIKELREKTSAGLALCKEALVKSEGDMEKAHEYVNERSDVISRLYNTTRAKIGLCKIAFDEADKDFEKAVEIIKERGWEGDAIEDPAEEKEGVLGVYVHNIGHKLVAVVELFCDTDFVAKNENFLELADKLAQQAAAMGAEYATPDDVPETEIEQIKEVVEKSEEFKDKPEEVKENIVEGKIEKLYEEKCLTKQKYFKDDEKTVRNLVDDAINTLGEKIYIGEIYRIELGKDL